MASQGSRKVVILGLDGATWDLLHGLITQDTMPNLASLLRKGSWGNLVTVVPPVTATSWTTFFTGLNPGKHGVFEFLLRRRGVSESAVSKRNPFGEVPVNSTLRDGKPLWVLADEAGLRSVVIGVPITYPPERINGVMISGFLTPLGKRDFVEPPEVLEELEQKFGPYKLYHRQVYSRTSVGKVIDELHEVLDFNIKVTRYLMKTRDWDLFFAHFWGTDRAQHELWHLLDSEHPHHDAKEALRYAPRLKGFYARLDDGLARIVEDAAGANILIASDHGFGPIHRFMSFNMWLMEHGYLHLRSDFQSFLKKFLFSLGFTPVLFYRLSMALGLARHRLAGGFHSRQKMQILLNRFFLSLEDVDWRKTLAYSRGNYGQIYVNLKGREPAGCVRAGDEYNRVREEIRAQLLATQDPLTGDQLIDRVYPREEIYEGPYVEEAPDLIFLPKDMKNKALGTLDFTSNRFIFPVHGNSGDHRMEGILLGIGNAFKQDYNFGTLSILDIAPTVMHLLGLGIPREMDGRVASEILDDDFAEQNPVRYTDNQLLGRAKGSVLSEEARDEIRRRLEGIGYVG